MTADPTRPVRRPLYLVAAGLTVLLALGVWAGYSVVDRVDHNLNARDQAQTLLLDELRDTQEQLADAQRQIADSQQASSCSAQRLAEWSSAVSDLLEANVDPGPNDIATSDALTRLRDVKAQLDRITDQCDLAPPPIPSPGG